MPTFVAFLRAINVGGRTVRMEMLKRTFESLGFSNVQTFIASGNVVFDTATTDAVKLTRTIERKLHDTLGYESAVFLRSAGELRALARYQPFPDDDDPSARTHVALLAAPPGKAVERKLAALRNDSHDFRVRGREVYWRRRSGVPFDDMPLEKVLGVPCTIRGVPTVVKMADKFCK